MTTYAYNLSISELEISVLKTALYEFIAKREQEADEGEDSYFVNRVRKQYAENILARLYSDPVLTSTSGYLHLPSGNGARRAIRPKSLTLSCGAEFSECRTYRYALWRRWEPSKPYVLFIGLNPSTADEVEDDPTLRRCYDFAKSWGYGGVCMVNLFAYRATDPGDMKKAVDPIGPENDAWIRDLAEEADLVVAAWGNDGGFLGRSGRIQQMLPDMKCIRINKGGEPAHPLYQPKTAVPFSLSGSK